MPKQINYEEKYNEVAKRLENEKSIALCTVDRDKVAARTVWFVFYKDSIYFATSKAYDKCKQIVRNPNVALCLDNIQIEGVALIIGHPELEDNKEVINYIAVKCPELNRYNKYRNSVLIEIKINKIATWTDGGREYINPAEKSAFRIG